MILINLLPHREERRKRRKIAFFSALGAFAVAGVLATGLWYLLLDQMTVAQQDRNSFLSRENAKLDIQIKDIATLRAEIESLKARQRAVEDLQTDRNIPVYLLNELARQTPEGIYFNSVKQEGQLVTVNGIAQTNERVSEFLRNTAYNSTWLERPELLEIKSANVQAATRDQKRLFEFSVRLSVKRPQDTSKSAVVPAGAPAPATAGIAAKS
jgi:type IV pilus assembly protein PilN